MQKKVKNSKLLNGDNSTAVNSLFYPSTVKVAIYTGGQVRDFL